MKVLGLEEIRLLALKIQDADEAILGDQWDSKFGADVGVGGNVAFHLGDVVDEHGLSRKGDLADYAFAEREAHALRFRRVTDLKTHPHFVGAVVDEKDREDAVGNDGADELGGAVEQGLQIERGVEGVGDLGEIARSGDSSRAFSESMWSFGFSAAAGR
jgi:hypothetical protein